MTDFEKSDDGWLKLRAPGKVNLMLSVHGRRKDGFHELTSLLAPLEFCDELELRKNELTVDTLVIEGIALPVDRSNLVLQAAQLYRQGTGRSECFDFRLHKRIPVGAGLGGGSSDAVAALKGLNAWCHTEIKGEQLRELASRIGSDCPFFVDALPAVMRGRGERIERINPSSADRLSGRKVVLFRPPFSIDTAWAYRQLAAAPEFYENEVLAERRLQQFCESGCVGKLLHNGFEAIVGRKFLAIPCLLEILREHGHDCIMSGSGSVCFALVENEEQVSSIKKTCLECWGENIFLVETLLA